MNDNGEAMASCGEEHQLVGNMKETEPSRGNTLNRNEMNSFPSFPYKYIYSKEMQHDKHLPDEFLYGGFEHKAAHVRSK